MLLKIKVNALCDGEEISGEQTIEVVAGEFELNEIFKSSFYRVRIDCVINDNVCFCILTGAIVAKYFVLKPCERGEYSRGESARTGFGGAVLDYTDFLFEVM